MSNKKCPMSRVCPSTLDISCSTFDIRKDCPVMRYSLICIALFLLPARLLAQGSDWPKFLGPLGTSVSSEKGILAPWPKAGPPIVWQRKLGTGYGAPSIANGKLYIFDRAIEKAEIPFPHSCAR